MTGPRFGATMAAGGGLLVGAVMALSAEDDAATAAASAIGPIIAVAAVAMVVGILVPLAALTPHRSEDDVRRDTRQLLAGPLRHLLVGRVVLGLLGAVVLPLIALAMLRSTDPSTTGSGGLLVFALLATVASELLERRLFFLASVAPRMPGMLR